MQYNENFIANKWKRYSNLGLEKNSLTKIRSTKILPMSFYGSSISITDARFMFNTFIQINVHNNHLSKNTFKSRQNEKKSTLI